MRCEQELCPNWSGDGDVCPCAVLGIERSSELEPWLLVPVDEANGLDWETARQRKRRIEGKDA